MADKSIRGQSENSLEARTYKRERLNQRLQEVYILDFISSHFVTKRVLLNQIHEYDFHGILNVAHLIQL